MLHRSKSFLPLLAAGLALAGCPSVDQTGPASIAIATFDTTNAVIPQPNDLAMQQAPGVKVPVQRELLTSFIEAGGFPADQESSITIPIGVRARAADGSYSATPSPAAGVDLATVTDDSVAIFRIDVSPEQQFKRCATPPTEPCWEASFANGQLVLRRNGPGGSRRWDSGATGARYVAATRNTIKTSDGLAVNADSAIAIAAASSADIKNPELLPTGLTVAQQLQLQGLRGILDNGQNWQRVPVAALCAQGGVLVQPCWIPVPDGNLPSAIATATKVIPRAEIASLQSFTIQPTALARPFTDTGSGVLPLPSDFLLDPATGLVRNVPAFGPAAAGLATLDGFSTTAPLLIPLSAPVDALTLTVANVRLFEVTATGPVPVPLLSLLPGAPAFNLTQQALLQPPTAITAGQASTIVIAPAVTLDPAAPVFLPPLKEKTQYLVIVTNGVKDAQAKPLQRSTLMDLLFSFQGDLCVPADQPTTCTSQVPGVSNADAAGLQVLRGRVGPVLDALSLRSCASGATCAALVYTVKTQSVKDVSKQLAAAPYGIEAAAGPAPGVALFSPAATAEFDPAQFGIPLAAFPSVQHFVQVTVPLIDATDHTTGALNPTFTTNLQVVTVPALVAVPKCAAPPCVAPLVVFHHGLGGSRYQMLTVANSLASKGFVVAAIDMPYHGERAFCTANAQCTTDGTTANGVCTPNPALATPTDTALAPGTCTTGKLLLNASLSTVASGNFFISSNFFRIRDAIRQDQLDQATLALALARAPAVSGLPQPAANTFAAALATTGVGVDPTKVYFGGISLGGIVGTSIAATNPRFLRAALSVPGGTLVDVFTTSPAFAAGLDPLFTSLGIDLACVQGRTNCDAATRAAQTAAFQQALAVAKWILDPADPVNYAATVVNKTFDPGLQPLITGGLFSATTDAYGQIVTNDQVVPNPTNRLLNNLAKAAGGARYNFTTYTSAGGVPAANGHGLLNTNFFGAATGAQIALQTAGDTLRQDFSQFLLDAIPPAATFTLP